MSRIQTEPWQPDSPGVIQILSDLEESVGRMQSPSLRYSVGSDLVETWRKVGDRRREAAALLAWGQLARDDVAIEAFVRAAGLFRELGDRAGEAEAQRLYGRVLCDSQRPAQAIEVLEGALNLFDAAGASGLGAMSVLLVLGRARRLDGRAEEAIPDLERVVRRAHALGDRKLEYDALCEFGTTLITVSEFKDGLSAFARAARFGELAYHDGLRWEGGDAAALAAKAAAFAESGLSREEAEIRDQAAELRGHWGEQYWRYQYGSSLRAAQLWEELGEHRNQAASLLRAGHCLDDKTLSHIRISLAALAQSRSLFKELGDRQDRKAIRNIRRETRRRERRLDEVERWIRRLRRWLRRPTELNRTGNAPRPLL